MVRKSTNDFICFSPGVPSLHEKYYIGDSNIYRQTHTHTYPLLPPTHKTKHLDDNHPSLF